MEPITLGWILAAALSGLIGNKADKAVDVALGKGFQAIADRLKQGNEPINNELQKAVRRSFLLAQQSIASECLDELTGGKKYRGTYDCPPEHWSDVKWLEQKLKQLKADLKAVDKEESIQAPVASLEEIESLLTPDGALAVNSIQTVREKLIALVKQEGGVSCYQAKAAAVQVGLFERMCAYFASEIKNNPEVRDIIQGQLLTQINANLKTQQITVQDLENSLRDLARDVVRDIGDIKELLERIDSQIAALSGRPAVPPQFQSIIADKTEGFVGRKFVFDAIEEFLQKQPNGYFIIEADPGVGKSAILAQYVSRTTCVAYFNVRSQGITAASEFLKSVCTQLIERYNLSYPKELHPDNTRDGNFLARLLDEIVRGNHALPLVIAVDALDEVDLNSQTAGANVLYLPASLPNGVYFILTKRPTPLPLVVNKQRIFDLMQYQAESLEDVQTYIRQRISESPALQEWIASRGLAEEEFVTALGEKSDRNFMYLRYVLPEIESGAYQDLNKIENLPEGLEQYYYQHWQHMGMTAKNESRRTKIKIVYVLAEAIKPVSCQMISQFTSEDAFTVQDVLDDWKQFLREQNIERQKRYSIYHASFQDFLHRQDIVQMAGVTLKDINALMAGDLLSKWKKRRDRE
jgi:hypothetical protein